MSLMPRRSDDPGNDSDDSEILFLRIFPQLMNDNGKFLRPGNGMR